MSVDALIQSDVDGVRLRAHAAVATVASLASLVVAALLGWSVGGAVSAPRLAAWLAALAGVVVVRAWLARAHRRAAWPAGAGAAPGVDPDVHPDAYPGDGPAERRAAWQATWLRRYRGAVLLHGAVWGVVAWLPMSIDDAQLQASIIFVLDGLVIGAMALTLFDLDAALLFALPATLPLVVRLGLSATPLPAATWTAGAMSLMMLAVLMIAGRRAERERLALAATRRAERQSTQGARDAEDLLHKVFEHAGQGISVFDAGLCLRAWNPQFVDLSGLPPAQVRAGMPLQVDLHGLARQGDGDPDVSRQQRPDGRLIETRRNPLPGGGLVMFLVDITERETGRAAAAMQQQKLALVLENTEQGFWYIDNDLLTTDANPAMCRMLGIPRAQLLGRSIYDFVDEANRQVFQHHVRLRAQGQAEGYEIALSRADGTLVHCYNNATPVFDAQGRKTGALGLFSDISAQKLAEQQVRLAGEQLAQKSTVLAQTLDNLAQGVLNVDAHGRCTAWNRRFMELLQIPESVMRDGPMLDTLRRYQIAEGHFGEQLEHFDAAGRRQHLLSLQGGAELPGLRYQRRRRDGVMLEVASHVAVDGSLVRTYTDVTAARAAETALIAARDEAERAREEAETANRAKSEFLSRMSHELRTPLNAILGFGQLLEADADDPLSAGQQQRVAELLRGGRHLLVLINDVLDIARIEAGMLQLALQPVDLAALAQECLSLVQPMAQDRGVALVLQFPPPPQACFVRADVTRLKQVLLNLLSNAIKFNRVAGKVVLAGRVLGEVVHIAVTDQGPGIAVAQLPRLFKAFERLDMDGAVEGTGVGLALSRSLVELMHGEIGVNSALGQGSMFWLRLPRSDAVPAAPGLPERNPASPGRGRRHDVLYIEDNEVNQVLMQGMLAHRPAIDLRLAALPEEGLAMAAAQAPDLVLLDIQLPGMDGFDVIRLLRELPALHDTPVIAVSANAMPSDLEDAARAGFADYLTKPVDLPRLLALVDRALARADG